MAGSLSFTAGDEIITALGAGTLTGAYTFAICIKPTSITANQSWLEAYPAQNYQFGIDGGFASDPVYDYNGVGSSLSTGTVPAAGAWSVHVISKASGTVAARMSRIVLSTGVVTHQNASGTLANRTAATSWRIGSDGSSFDYAGLMTTIGLWKSVLSDANRETLLSHAAFAALSPDVLWRLDGSSPFDSEIGSATQSSISGTAHSTDEPTDWWGAPASLPTLVMAPPIPA